MIHNIQRQWCIWPQECAQQSDKGRRASRWDKVIGLIPQTKCLFKIFYYNAELIPQKELEQCVHNEIASMTNWAHSKTFFIMNKVGENWQVVTWIWNEDEVTFAHPVTHQLPALAYFLGKSRATQGILYYTEPVADDINKSWAITWNNASVVEHLYPMNSQIHARVIKQLLNGRQYNLFANVTDDVYLDGHDISPFHRSVKQKIMTKAKCSSQVEFDNPWIYWRTMVAVLFIFCLYLSADATLMKYEQSQLTDLVAQEQQKTLSIQNQRSRYEDDKKFVEQYLLAKKRQEFIAQLLDELTTKLAKDVVITQLTYDQTTVLLEGTVLNSTALLESLSNIPFIKTARLLGEVVPTSDGRQKFRAEVILKEFRS